MEVDLGPSQLPLKGPRVGRMWKVREEAGNTKRAFSGFEAEPGQTPHQSLFGRLRAFANEALHPNLAAGGGSAARGTRRRSHQAATSKEHSSMAVPGRSPRRVSLARRDRSRTGSTLRFVRRRGAPELYRGTGMPRRSPCVRSTAGPSTSMT